MAKSIAVYDTGLSASAVEWNPFESNILTVSTSSNFGIIGSGRQVVLSYRDGKFKELASTECKEPINACAWSESNKHVMALGRGDGTLTIWNYSTNTTKDLTEHRQDIHAVDWNLVTRDTILTGGWDNSIKLWNADASQSIRTFTGHPAGVNAVSWHPKYADMFASVCDKACNLWDINDTRPVLSIPAHREQIMAVEWSKYDEYQMFTGAVDKLIRIWDIRKAKEPVHTLAGHEFAIRRLKVSPHDPRILASASFDMTCALWDITKLEVVQRFEEHTEFVHGVDFSNLVENRIATCSWDGTVRIWKVDSSLFP